MKGVRKFALLVAILPGANFACMIPFKVVGPRNAPAFCGLTVAMSTPAGYVFAGFTGEQEMGAE